MKTKLTKKFVSVLLALAMLFSITAIASNADSTANPLFTITDVETRQGEEFDVTIKFARNSSPGIDPIAALDVSLYYDAGAFTVIDSHQGAGLANAFKVLENDKQLGLDGGDFLYKSSTNVPGEIKWSLVTLKGFTFKKGEDFAVIKFKANEKFNIESKLDMTVKVTNATAPNYTDKTNNYSPYTNNVDVELNLTTLCDWEYNAANKSYILKKFNDVNATQFTIPDVYEDPATEYGPCPVTKIDTSAFRGSTKIQKIVLGKNISVVGSAAFYGCSSLKRIVVFNKDTAFSASALHGASDGLVVKCFEGSTADTYVKYDTYAYEHGYVAEYFESLANCTVKGISEQVNYTGEPIELSAVEVYNSANVKLIQGTDYTITYLGNVEMGTASVTITGRGEYIGEKTVEFLIICPHHNYESGYYTETPIYTDCEVGGKIVKDCSFCKYHDESVTLPAKEHVTDDWVVITEPTCANVGCKALVCKDCGKNVQEVELSKLEHANVEKVITTPVTCESDGLESYICKDCQEVVETKTITALGHKESQEWTVVLPASCTQAGSESRFCENCDKVYETREIPVTEHVESQEWTVVLPASCTQAGSESRFCENCDKIYETREIPATNHAESQDWQVTVPVSCTADGLEVKTCTKCEVVLREHIITSPGHSLGEWETTLEPTCTELGSKHRVCSVCHESVQVKEIPIIEHTLGDWVIKSEPSCIRPGSKQRVCSMCEQAIQTKEIPATGHTPGEWETVVEPDCTQKGLKQQVCTSCHMAANNEEIPAKGHKPEYVVVTLPTYRHTGLEKQVCTVCKADLGRVRTIAKIYPDVTGDKKVNSSDALLILQHATGIKLISNTYIKNADVNGDAKVNSTDALLILQIATGIVKL